MDRMTNSKIDTERNASNVICDIKHINTSVNDSVNIREERRRETSCALDKKQYCVDIIDDYLTNIRLGAAVEITEEDKMISSGDISVENTERSDSPMRVINDIVNSNSETDHISEMNDTDLLFASTDSVDFSNSVIDMSVSDLDSSQELERRDARVDTYNSKYSTLQPTCKRCGVLFVASGASDVVNGKLDRWMPIAKRQTSFIVVKGSSSNIWSLPKGRLTSDNETEEECAIREVFEETGIKLETVAGLPKIVIGKNIYFVFHTTRQAFSTFDIQDNYEVSEVAWKTADQLKGMLCNKDLRAILKYPQKCYSYHRLIYHYQPQPRYIHPTGRVMEIDKFDRRVLVSLVDTRC